MVNVKHITLTSEELEKCREFSMRSASSQQAIEFGQHTTKARSVKEIARDNLIGKIAEVAFSKMMKENYGIDVPLDFNYYPAVSGIIRTPKSMAGELMLKAPAKAAVGC